MKKALQMICVLTLAFTVFSAAGCRQASFTGVSAAKSNAGGVKDILISFEDDNSFDSIYSNGARILSSKPVSAKKRKVTIKIVTYEKYSEVKINKHITLPSENNALEYFSTVGLKIGVNKIPVEMKLTPDSSPEIIYVQVHKKDAEGALGLTVLEYNYEEKKDAETTEDVYTDILYSFDENNVFKRDFYSAVPEGDAKKGRMVLRVGSLSAVTVELDGGVIEPVSSSSEYNVYNFQVERAARNVVITTKDSKGSEVLYRAVFGIMNEDDSKSANIKSITAVSDAGSIFELRKLKNISPFKKGNSKDINKSINENDTWYEIDSIYKLKRPVIAMFEAGKLDIIIEPEQSGSKIEILGRWLDVDHSYASGNYDGSKWVKPGEYPFEERLDNFAQFEFYKQTDDSLRFYLTDTGKFDLAVKVTSPDGTKSKIYELKYGFITPIPLIYDLKDVKAFISGTNGTKTKLAVIKENNDVFQTFVPNEAESVLVAADDSFDVNGITGYRKRYAEMLPLRYYLSVNNGKFTRSHPNTKDDPNGVTIPFGGDSQSYDISIVTYHDGELKDGKFVDEYGETSGVFKIQRNFKFDFIRMSESAPALTVLKIEGEVPSPTSSCINGKIYPVMSFRPAQKDYKMHLAKKNNSGQPIKYKLLMLKTDPEAEIFVKGEKVTATETFEQKYYDSSSKFPEPTTMFATTNKQPVTFYSYVLNASGDIKNENVSIVVKKGSAARDYQLSIIAADEDAAFKLFVVREVNGSPRAGTEVYYKEHDGTSEIAYDASTKKTNLTSSNFSLLGTSDSNGFVNIDKSKGVKAGRYYDFYALGDNDKADSIIENYYISGDPDLVLPIVQVSLLQNGGGANVMRPNTAVKFKKADSGVYFFVREYGGVGGGFGGSSDNESAKAVPLNLSLGNAHLNLNEKNRNDIVVWFEVDKTGNAVEPASHSGFGVKLGIDSVPFSFGPGISFSNYDKGKISLEKSAIDQQDAFRLKMPSGTFELIIVAYDIAGNRIQRHQFVSAERSEKMAGTPISNANDSIKIENFRAVVFRFPVSFSLYEDSPYFEKLFGMPYKQYVDNFGKLKDNPTSYFARIDCIARSGNNPIDIQGLDVYRKCVEDGGEFKKVGSTIYKVPIPSYFYFDTDSLLEEGKTYQYKVIAFTDEGNCLESDYAAEIKVPEAFTYHLSSPEDKKVFYVKKYDKDFPKKDRENLKINFQAKLTTGNLWSKKSSDVAYFGLAITERNGDPAFGIKGAYEFLENQDPRLLLFVPSKDEYVSLDELQKMGMIPEKQDAASLVNFDASNNILTITKDIFKYQFLDIVSVYSRNPVKFEFQAGKTYYWDIVDWGRYIFSQEAISFMKRFYARNKDNSSEYYFNKIGNKVIAGFSQSAGHGWGNGNNSMNGRFSFSVKYEE